MGFAEIALKDKVVFERYLSKYNTQASELTFTNLFMWREFYKIRFTEFNGVLCIISVPEDAEPFAFIPVGDTSFHKFGEAILMLKEYFVKKGWQLKFNRVTDSGLSSFKELEGMDFEIVPDRDSSDYVYA